MVGASIRRNPINIWFDFVDPASVLLMLEIEAARRDNVSWMHMSTIKWHALELRPPPTPMVSLEEPEVASCWESALPLAEKVGVVLDPPHLVPWTRKAHELVVHAEKTRPQSASALRLSVAIAYAIEGQDIGRVDLLVKIASNHGLDRTECKAVLDVDKYETVVTASAKEAKAAYVTYVPTIVWGAKRLEGFHNRTALGTLLGT
jgi:predicted DsbA family dithiol-disulfide isomerase